MSSSATVALLQQTIDLGRDQRSGSHQIAQRVVARLPLLRPPWPARGRRHRRSPVGARVELRADRVRDAGIQQLAWPVGRVVLDVVALLLDLTAALVGD